MINFNKLENPQHIITTVFKMDQSIEKKHTKYQNDDSTKRPTASCQRHKQQLCYHTNHKTDIHANTKSNKTLTVSTFNSHKHRNNDNYKGNKRLLVPHPSSMSFVTSADQRCPCVFGHPKALTTFVQSESAASLLLVTMELK